jgi:hypothetical protein
MLARLLGFLTVFTVLVVPAPARSADKEKSGAPTIVIRLDSINNLIEDVKYLATLSGQKDKAEEGLGFVKAAVDSKSIDKAIDFNRPLAMYASIDAANPTESPGAFLIPLADEKRFLDLLEQNQLTAEKGDDGVYTLNLPFPPIPIYFRFANKYVYITAQNKSAVTKENLLDPSKVFGSGKMATLSGEFRLDQIPDEVKEMLVSQLESEIAKEKEKTIPGETEALTKIRHKLIDETTKQFAILIKEAGQVVFSLDVDRKAGELKAEGSFSGKPGSSLAAGIAKLSKAESLFAGLASSQSAMDFLAHLVIPENIRQAYEPLVDEGIKEALKDEKDSTKREWAEKVFKALEPTLKAGEFDGLFTLRGPGTDKHYTFLTAIKIKEGQKVEQVARDLVKVVPERDRDMIKLDADKAGSVKIHRVDIQEKYDEKVRNVLGDNPLYLAFSQNALLLSGGADGLSLLKEAVKAEPKAAPLMQDVISMAKLALLIERRAGREGGATAAEESRKASEEAFGKGDKNSDQIRFIVEGGPSLKGSFVISASVVKFLAQTGTHEASFQEKPGKAKKKPEGERKKIDRKTENQ